MELRGHTRHSHRHHHSHYHSSHKSRNASKSLGLELRVNSHGKHARSPAHGPISYVESWLEGTHTLAAVSNITPAEVPKRSKDRKRYRQHEHRRSHDSSIIAPALPALSRHGQPSDKHRGHRPSDMPFERQNARDTVQRKRTRPSPSMQSDDDDDDDDDAHTREERRRYEKRARHKTREDKYEQNRGGAVRKPVADETKRRKKKSHDTHNKKSAALATAGDLMDKFSSRAIHNDRLTMKPTMLAGIFRNSKVDRAPGDLTFGEMNFLKNRKSQEATKSVPKSRASDQRRNQKELDDIEVFFSRRTPEILNSNKTSRENGEQHNLEKPTATDGSPQTKTGSSRDSLASKATTYISWSSSNHAPTRPDDCRNEPSNGAVFPRSERWRKHSRTPQSVQQALIETGVYRPLAAPEQHLYGPVNETREETFDGHDVETETAEWRPSDEVPAGASESREHNAQQAYSLRRDHVSRLQEGPPLPPDSPNLGNGRDRGAQQVTVSPRHDENLRYVPSDRSRAHRTQQTIPTLRTAVSSTNSGISSQFQSAAALAPRVRPLSSLLYAPSALPPGLPLRPRPIRSPGHVPAVSNAGRRPLNPWPHNRSFLEITSSPHPPRGPAHPEDRIPELYASDGRFSPPRGVERESMHEYIENLERKVLGDNDENIPPAVPSPDAGSGDAYLTPYFRHWPAEDRWAAPRHAPRGQAVLEGKDLLLDRHQGTRWPAGIDHKAGSGISRYWKPNTFGL